MHFLVDEDLPRSVDRLLSRNGYDVTDIRDVGLRGASDADIAAYAQEHGLCLLTADMGFADIRNYPPAKYSGIVVLRLPAKANSSIILTLLESFLVQTEIVNHLNGRLAIVEIGRVRIRKD